MFTPSLFRFLRDLALHNDKDWFHENHARYVAAVRTPCLEFIEAVGPPLSEISLHVQAIPAAVGGSLLLPHRDRRFARDLPPYKGFAGIHFRHEAVHTRGAGPGYYLHLEPGRVYLAAGVRRPRGEAATAIRTIVIEDPPRTRKVLRAKAFRENFALNGERRSRPPPGVDPEHPLLDVLLLKDFSAVVKLTQRRACASDFPDQAVALMRGAIPWMKLLCDALDLDF